MKNNKTRYALISVFNKEGIKEFTRNLIENNFIIISSGGTARHLIENDIPVIDVADYTGLSPMLDHRVATLHPKIHAGLLADLTNEKHLEEMKQHDYKIIDLVCVDFYPLEDEIKNTNATDQSILAKVDIGGPTMVRAGAKGKRIVVCDPIDRASVIVWLQEGEPNSEAFLRTLAAKAERTVSNYCAIAADYLER